MPQDTLSFMQRVQEYGVFGLLWMMFIALSAGTSRYLVKLNGLKPTFWGWITETFCSGFVGLIVAMVCKSYAIDFYLTSAIVGICAHNGTRSLYILSRLIKKNTGVITDILDGVSDKDLKYAKKKEPE